MARALRLARLGLCTTHPNPRVGCVIVAGGEVVGEAWHERAGAPHAEILALRQAGEKARGATVYLNLEPCCHQGRTPPCTDALINAGVSRVVASMQDPNPQVGGGGIRILRGAGIDVEIGLMEESAETLNRGFISRMTLGRPWVSAKVAASIDGRIAMADGESQWITSEAARRDVHRLRAAASAVMTGSGTVLADNPALTARGDGISRQPLRVLVDGALRVPQNARLFQEPTDVVVATALDEGPSSYGPRVEVAALPGDNRRVDLVRLMQHLGDRGINEILVEAGPSLNGALLKNGLVDEIVFYFAPKCLGTRAIGMFELPQVKVLDQHVGLKLVDLRQIGPDIKATFLVQRD